MYEDELYDIFISNLEGLYGVFGEDMVYIYLKVRYLISKLEKKNSYDCDFELIRFLLSEINIPVGKKGEFVYKNKNILTQEIINILDNWKFRASLCFSGEDINTHIDTLFTEVIKKTNPVAKKEAMGDYYYIYLKYYALKELRRTLEAYSGHSKMINGISYPTSHNEFKRSLEDELEGLVAGEELVTSNVNLVTEEQVEDYLIRNIDKLEKGMKFLDRQVVIEEGRIDILAEDEEGTKVILEIKINEDKNIIWQSKYYPKMFKEKYNLDKVRMITLCPSYSSKIKTLLSSEIEAIRYKLRIEKRKIVDIYFFKTL